MYWETMSKQGALDASFEKLTEMSQEDSIAHEKSGHLLFREEENLYTIGSRK